MSLPQPSADPRTLPSPLRVLKLTGISEILRIQLAQGQDKTAKLAEEDKKLQANISKDVTNAGKAMTGLS